MSTTPADFRGQPDGRVPRLLSAHGGMRPALQGCEVDYVEVDVQRCGDGTFVVFHDQHMLVDGLPVAVADVEYDVFAAVTGGGLRYEEALTALAARGQRIHLDLKFVSPDDAYAEPSHTFEVEATRLALERLGGQNVIVTTLVDRSVSAVRRWACRHGHDDLLVGLSLGRACHDLGLREAWRTHVSELFPEERFGRCGANLVVAHHWLARLGVARFAERHRLPLLVWTVDGAQDLRYWLQGDRAWLVTTNRPRLAHRIRTELSARPLLRDPLDLGGEQPLLAPSA